MARQPRVDVPNVPYHVINRAVGRLTIFNNDSDYRLFVDLLTAAKEKTGMSILAFTVMPNHWHLVLHPEKEGEMKTFMHLLTNAHTRRVHTLTNTTGTGPLYQGRYKSFIIDTDVYLQTVIRYVERNPVRAGLSTLAEAWKWGSAWVRLCGTPKQQQLLSAGPTPLPGNYRAWVNTEDAESTIHKLRTSVNKGTPFGRAAWVSTMVDTHNLKATQRGSGRPKGSKNR